MADGNGSRCIGDDELNVKNFKIVCYKRIHKLVRREEGGIRRSVLLQARRRTLMTKVN